MDWISCKCILQTLGQPPKKKKENTERIRKERNWNHLKCSIKPQKASTRMNLENVVLSEVSQTEKDK